MLAIIGGLIGICIIIVLAIAIFSIIAASLYILVPALIIGGIAGLATGATAGPGWGGAAGLLAFLIAGKHWAKKLKRKLDDAEEEKKQRRINVDFVSVTPPPKPKEAASPPLRETPPASADEAAKPKPRPIDTLLLEPESDRAIGVAWKRAETLAPDRSDDLLSARKACAELLHANDGHSGIPSDAMRDTAILIRRHLVKLVEQTEIETARAHATKRSAAIGEMLRLLMGFGTRAREALAPLHEQASDDLTSLHAHLNNQLFDTP
jgi:hypothetical protein